MHTITIIHRADVGSASSRRARHVRRITLLCSLFILGTLLVPQLGQAQFSWRQRWRTLQGGDRGRLDGQRATTPTLRYRSFDGTGNNRLHARWGAAGTDYLREARGPEYADGRSRPAGTNRPSAREISNTIADQGDIETEDDRGLATAIYEFGQFLDHDFGLAAGGSTEDFDIHVPVGDPFFDPTSTGTTVIFLDRSAFDPATGTRSPRQQINTATAFIDASQVYGSDATRAAWLRTFIGGRLKSRDTDIGELLPLNDGTQANDNPVGAPPTSLIVAGDRRANEQPGLTVLHTVFLREHNREAARLAALHPNWNDELLYQEARRFVGAEMQAITYNEFVPALLGRRLSRYRGYQSDVNPGLSNLFATAAYRFGHSQVGPDIGVVDGDFVEIDSIDLADAFFAPGVIPAIDGIDPIVRYMAVDGAQQIDSMVVGPLRNFLFGPPGAGGFDLASLNIQRGRDHGLQDYNRVRADFGLRPVRAFGEITTNADLAARLQRLYRSVDEIDPWVGMLAEDHVPGSSLGPTASAVLTDQFRRLRDGDRFWYQNDQFAPADLARIESTRLADVLQRNSGVTGLQPAVFFTTGAPGGGD